MGDTYDALRDRVIGSDAARDAIPAMYDALRAVAAEHGAGARDDEVRLSSKTWDAVHAALRKVEQPAEDAA